jgi:hypothetical protein
MRIGIFGAPGTGKTWLAHGIQNAQPVDTVIEYGATTPPTPPDIALLMGLDVGVPSSARELADAQLRDSLRAANLHFQVVYGQAQARLRNALRAINPAAKQVDATTWRWVCDTCSDPVCEHKLFTKLLAS